MAASSVARRIASLSLTLLMSGMALAQSVAPSNTTLPKDETTAVSALTLSGEPLFAFADYIVAPLTPGAGRGLTDVSVC